MPKLTRSQTKQIAVRRATETRRWHILCDCIDEGTTLAEAARRAGMKEGGATQLLYRHLGSTKWPVNEPSLIEPTAAESTVPPVPGPRR